MTRPDPALLAALERARSLGFLGPGPAADHIAHADGFLAGLEGVTGLVIDLGSGGGVPGLVVAVARPDLEVVLLDALAKRCRFLEDAVAALEASARVRVAHGRAEVLGRTELRGTAQAVLARSFGPPAATAECAAPLLAVGGRLLVSEPPDGGDRWPAEPVGRLGLEPGPLVSTTPHVRVLHQVGPCPDTAPRRDGLPAKRPLF
jgi:16S rRNA (guanine527-N7)-methyltransferase